jgi:hypothetical protein
MGVQLLLGTDVLDKFGGVINYDRNEVSLGCKVYEFRNQETTFSGVAEILTEVEIDSILDTYEHVFYSDKRGLTEAKGILPMRIKTEGVPIYSRPYRAALTKRSIIDDSIDEMLADNIIEPSMSPWASPVTLAPKKDGSWRFCVDYRRLNSMTRKDKYPLPHIQDIFDNVGKGRIFSCLDLKRPTITRPL